MHFDCNARLHYLCLLEQHYNSLGASCRLLKRPWHLSTMALRRANLPYHTGTILVIIATMLVELQHPTHGQYPAFAVPTCMSCMNYLLS